MTVSPPPSPLSLSNLTTLTLPFFHHPIFRLEGQTIWFTNMNTTLRGSIVKCHSLREVLNTLRRGGALADVDKPVVAHRILELTAHNAHLSDPSFDTNMRECIAYCRNYTVSSELTTPSSYIECFTACCDILAMHEISSHHENVPLSVCTSMDDVITEALQKYPNMHGVSSLCELIGRLGRHTGIEDIMDELLAAERVCGVAGLWELRGVVWILRGALDCGDEVMNAVFTHFARICVSGVFAEGVASWSDALCCFLRYNAVQRTVDSKDALRSILNTVATEVVSSGSSIAEGTATTLVEAYSAVRMSPPALLGRVLHRNRGNFSDQGAARVYLSVVASPAVSSVEKKRISQDVLEGGVFRSASVPIELKIAGFSALFMHLDEAVWPQFVQFCANPISVGLSQNALEPLCALVLRFEAKLKKLIFEKNGDAGILQRFLGEVEKEVLRRLSGVAPIGGCVSVCLAFLHKLSGALLEFICSERILVPTVDENYSKNVFTSVFELKCTGNNVDTILKELFRLSKTKCLIHNPHLHKTTHIHRVLFKGIEVQEMSSFAVFWHDAEVNLHCVQGHQSTAAILGTVKDNGSTAFFRDKSAEQICTMLTRQNIGMVAGFFTVGAEVYSAVRLYAGRLGSVKDTIDVYGTLKLQLRSFKSTLSAVLDAIDYYYAREGIGAADLTYIADTLHASCTLLSLTYTSHLFVLLSERIARGAQFSVRFHNKLIRALLAVNPGEYTWSRGVRTALEEGGVHDAEQMRADCVAYLDVMLPIWVAEVNRGASGGEGKRGNAVPVLLRVDRTALLRVCERFEYDPNTVKVLQEHFRISQNKSVQAAKA